MTLKEYYQSLAERSTPRKELRNKIVAECGIKELTVYRYLSGEIVPDKLKRERIAQITGIPEEELFPNAQA